MALLSMNVNAQSEFNQDSPRASTYSIVARDPQTGEIGVAVQSHWFNVGPVVAWGEAGVGVIATQSFVNTSFGLRGLDLLKKGMSPQEVVDELIASDEGADFRQVAVLDVTGRTASYTGSKCIGYASNLAEENVSVQANLMLSDRVVPEMLESFKKSPGPLAERMLAALEAAQDAGGDIRGMQSASLILFKGMSTGKPWEEKVIDLRVEDNPEPLKELKRLLKIHRAYEHMNNADLAVEKGDMELAMMEYSAAENMLPDNTEMKYWHAVMLVNNGRLEESLPLFKGVFEADSNWKILTPRLLKSGLLKATEAELTRILFQ